MFAFWKKELPQLRELQPIIRNEEEIENNRVVDAIRNAVNTRSMWKQPNGDYIIRFRDKELARAVADNMLKKEVVDKLPGVSIASVIPRWYQLCIPPEAFNKPDGKDFVSTYGLSSKEEIPVQIHSIY